MTEFPPAEWSIEWRNRLESTNAVLKRSAGRGAPAGTVLAAVSQSDGRGRGENHWTSPPGGLYFSYVLREVPKRFAPLVPLAAGTAVLRTIHALNIPVTAWMKWPNDIMIGALDADEPAGKAGGILVESVSKGERIDHIIVGVGINLRTEVRDLPKDTDPQAVCFGHFASRLPTVERFLDQHIDDIGDVLRDYGKRPAELIDDAQEELAWLGQEIRVVLSDDAAAASSHGHGATPSLGVTGTFEGITTSGAIRLDVAGDEVVIEPWNIGRVRLAGR